MITYDPHLNPKDIYIVGLGGTGSQVSRSVCRMVYDMQSKGLDVPTLHFIDPDIVEPKNVGRQMFTPADVGRFKAEVLARRFNLALGLDVRWYGEMFDATKHQSDWHGWGHARLIIGCVDSHHGRREMAKTYAVVIDCGNHHDSGQVVIGDVHSVQKYHQYPHDDDELQHLPSAYALFPDLLKPDAVSESSPVLSCADLTLLGEQQLLVNEYVALAASQYVYKLLYRQPIRTFMTFVDAETISMRSEPITREGIDAYLPQGESHELVR